MEKKTINNLKRKGWSPEDIRKTEAILESRTRVDKSRSIPTANRIVFWTIFAVMVIANFLVSLTLIPFLLVLNKSGLDLIIIIIGLGFGLMFDFLMNISSVSRSYKLVAGIAVPLIAILNFILITYISNSMNTAIKLTQVEQNPITISAVYVAAFIAPYILDLAIKKYFSKEQYL